MSPSERDLVVDSFELFLVPPRWLFLKLTTRGGLTGWGEPVIEGRAATVRAAVEELMPQVVGRPANRIEDLWQELYRGGFYRGGPILMSALAGIDQALWDIRGKSLGVPVYELLGGPVRERMKAYAWIGGDRPDDVANAARERLQAGFRAVKMNASGEMDWIETPQKVAEVEERLAAVREAVGDEAGVAVDFHGRLHRGMAGLVAKRMEPYQPMFIEEPLTPGHEDLLPLLRAQTSIPIATGERMYSRWEFKNVLPVVDIVQPDLSHAGGISEVRRIAAMAEAYDVALAPHCPLGPIALAACLQVDFTSINAFIQESSLGIHYNEGTDLLDYLVDPDVYDLKDGCFQRPLKPGLGIEINEEAVREKSREGHSWKSPLWRGKDGAVTEW